MEHGTLSGFREELQRKLAGELSVDDVTRAIYSTDASLYRMMPSAVVFPKQSEDVVQTIRTAAKFGIPILARGAGTSLAGQTVTSGVVVDCSRHMNRVLEVNAKQRWARVQPGIVLDNLNDFLSFYQLFFPPDVATSSRATVGGMIGNNSAGSRSISYGKTVDHVIALKVVLATGEVLEFNAKSASELSELCARKDREGQVYKQVLEIVESNIREIRRRYPQVLRRVGGYNLDYLIESSDFNLSQLLTGAEGTLGFVIEAKVNLVPIPKARAVAIPHFRTLVAALQSVEAILRHKPSAVEILDSHTIDLASQNPAVANLCRQFVRGRPRALLIVEFSGDDPAEIREKVELVAGDQVLRRESYYVHRCMSRGEQQSVWTVRKNALGVLLSMRGDAKPLPFIEDAAIPIPHLSAYIQQILKVCEDLERDVALYAHASVGVLHVRPILNLKQPEDVEILQKISQHSFDLVRQYGGAWSGEHGDGLVRSYKNREFFGDQLYEAFRAIKRIFDPAGLMNPGKVVDSPAMTQNLRIGPHYGTDFPETFFRFQEFGGFDRAIEMCTGVGHCRKTLEGTMCPSYMVTRDEEHSTRGRANALRSAIAGELGAGAFTSQRLYEVLDLCLECKACKSECPSNVDMARMKAEFLAHYYKQHGLPLGKRLVAKTRRLAELGSRFPSLFNGVNRSRLVRLVLEKLAGFDRRRILPPLAPTTLEAWHRKNVQPKPSRPRVVLLADTFTNFYEPQVGIAAIRVLEALGLSVELIASGCCGRPLISSGQLEEARKQGTEVYARLDQLVPDEVPIIVLEPSCLATFKDDLPDLVGNPETAAKVASRIQSLEEFLAGTDYSKRLRTLLEPDSHAILFHGHCQQKALFGTETTMNALRLLPETAVTQVDSGCCGMAGSFGYEKQHYALSKLIGSRRLFRAVDTAELDTTIVACGFSCRAQIRHFTKRQAQHLAEVLANRLSQT